MSNLIDANNQEVCINIAVGNADLRSLLSHLHTFSPAHFLTCSLSHLLLNVPPIEFS